MSSKHSITRKKYKLFEQNPYCHYCGQLTVISETKIHGSFTPRGFKLPKNEATLDHVYSKFDKERYEKKHGESHKFVLSCRKCNCTKERDKCALYAKLHKGHDTPPIKELKDIELIIKNP